MPLNNTFDIIVIGGGHAGIEASMAAARMGSNTALLSMDFHTIGRLSCNPSIGGSAKGHLAKEIDALGGVMGVLADRSGLQFKMLNRSKGPAVWSPRSQNDKDLYPLFAQQMLLQTPNLTLIYDTAEEILISQDRVKGIRTRNNELFSCRCIVLCSGTFLNGVMYTGLHSTKGGRVGEQSSEKISDVLAAYGLEKGRLKTGTPPRIAMESIDLSKTEIAGGDSSPQPFSYRTTKVVNNLVCYSTNTHEQTHDILREGFSRSPMFTGLIAGAGPRYCPSIEDKIARFSERNSHQILLEPEGLNTNSVYVNGFSTSLPQDIQERGLRSIPGLELCQILRYGYAVEYDFFFPYQLKFSLETKAIQGLYFAGQINGTSGYEEAASQGLIAGINAASAVKGLPEFTLLRSEAYIGVLIDDLVNKNTEEPYRIFTSLAEYRLLLRQDNAKQRLMQYGHNLGLVSDRAFEQHSEQEKRLQTLKATLSTYKVRPNQINDYLESRGETPLFESVFLYDVAKRPSLPFGELIELFATINEQIQQLSPDADIIRHAETDIRYAGYIQRQLKDVENFKANEHKRIPAAFDYDKVTSLSREGRDKLKKIRPQSLGQASRISGVSASDVSILSVYLR